MEEHLVEPPGGGDAVPDHGQPGLLHREGGDGAAARARQGLVDLGEVPLLAGLHQQQREAEPGQVYGLWSLGRHTQDSQTQHSRYNKTPQIFFKYGTGPTPNFKHAPPKHRI